jgi:hypothetical protein
MKQTALAVAQLAGIVGGYLIGCQIGHIIFKILHPE